ncbi:TRAP transporter permease [Virgibacillus alimentarius]|uniref:TRAP transporter 4TM/12TM fusion protein n=1 Tax=Virgibacillus alimentarius TaxID=698769 RepID=A0ABS4S8E0_9BACI|nr:TRAP transporter permease [Virgibacillus alimentarius]MBP2257756.1 TRAP transporter 4TM/12TM fusion protein [Virgibacillus alimentarius]
MLNGKENTNNNNMIQPSDRYPDNWRKFIVVGVSIILSVFALLANSFLNIQTIHQNSIFLMLALFLAFLLYSPSKEKANSHFSLTDLSLAILSAIFVGYILFGYTSIHVERLSQAVTIDYIFAAVAVILLLEGTRRALGLFIPMLILSAMLYAIIGPYLSGMFGHAGFSMERLLYRIYMTTEGIFGMTLSIAATYIVIFIIFGAFLSVSGASKLFNDLALAVAGRYRGGPAQVSVLTSSLTGSLSGSAVANVATTGTFTIPLMKSVGFKSRFAGAVEATASTGGMMMPPIMGAAAFIMAGFLGLPYPVIVLAAIMPTFLYYSSLIFAINIESRKQGLEGISKESIPQVFNVLKERGLLLLPLLIVIGLLLAGFTPLFSGFIGILSVIIASWLTRDPATRVTPKKILKALHEGAKGSVQVTMACASVGIMIAVVSMTGIGEAIATNILSISNGHLFVALLLVMVTCIVLSMGLPSTALYIVVAVTVAPALIEMGVNDVAAHFFVFWFGALSSITPPVALASYTASGLAKSDAMKTSWSALRLALPGFVIPFMITFNPTIVIQGSNVNFISILFALLTTTCIIFALTVEFSQFFLKPLTWWEQVLFLFSAVLLMFSNYIFLITGFVLIGVTIAIHLYQYQLSKRPYKASYEGELNG